MYNKASNESPACYQHRAVGQSELETIMRYYTPKVDCVCSYCGAQFQIIPSKAKRNRGKFCSKACFYASRAKIERTCQICSKSFEANPYTIKHGGGKYCSRSCYDIAQSNQIECVCEQCGKSFTKDPFYIKNGGGKYCSKACHGLAHRGENHHFWRGGFARYRGPNWSVQRKAAYKRDKGICQHCGKKPKIGQRQFQVHHIKPFRDFHGDYLTANQLTNLITLCPVCHKHAEYGKIAIQPYLL